MVAIIKDNRNISDRIIRNNFKWGYDQLLENFKAPPRISPLAKIQKINEPPGGFLEDLLKE